MRKKKLIIIVVIAVIITLAGGLALISNSTSSGSSKGGNVTNGDVNTGGASNSTVNVTDLTNVTWTANNDLVLNFWPRSDDGERMAFNVNLTKSGYAYTSLSLGYFSNKGLCIFYRSDGEVMGMDWESELREEPAKIKFHGGADIKNKNLINWLAQNGTFTFD